MLINRIIIFCFLFTIFLFPKVGLSEDSVLQTLLMSGAEYLQEGNFQKAKENLKKALEIDPENTIANDRLARIYFEKKKYNKAIKYLTRNIQNNSMDESSNFIRGLAFAEKRRHKKANQDYDKVIKINPKHKSVYFYRAISLAKLKKYEEAITDYTKAIEITPNNPVIYNNRGYIFIKNLDDKDKGCEDWKKACTLGKCNNYYASSSVTLLTIEFTTKQSCHEYLERKRVVSPVEAKHYKTEKPPSLANAGDIWINPADSREMVYIPSGEFIMGFTDENIHYLSKEISLTNEDKKKIFKYTTHKKENINSFWIDKYLVRAEELLVFAKKKYGDKITKSTINRYHRERGRKSLHAGEVSWDVANEYCSYYNKNLPSEAQWEKAARGSDAYLYPWGNKLPTETGFTKLIKRPSPYGVMEMVGVANQWCKAKGKIDGTRIRRGGPALSSPLRNRTEPKDTILDLLIPSSIEMGYEKRWDPAWYQLVGKETIPLGYTLIAIYPSSGFRCIFQDSE